MRSVKGSLTSYSVILDPDKRGKEDVEPVRQMDIRSSTLSIFQMRRLALIIYWCKRTFSVLTHLIGSSMRRDQSIGDRSLIWTQCHLKDQMLLSYFALLPYLFFSSLMAQSEEQLVWMKNLMALARQHGEELRRIEREKQSLGSQVGAKMKVEEHGVVEGDQIASLEGENMSGNVLDQMITQQ